MNTDTTADVLDEYATFLRLDGQEGRAYAYEGAAREIRKRRFLPPNPAEIDGIGDQIRDTLATYQRRGSIPELDALKAEYEWYDELRHVDGIGPSRAEQLHEKFNINTIDELLMVGEDLTLADGIGPTRADKILDAALDAQDA